jgi:hypothetical protein
VPVPALGVIEHLDVVEDVPPGLFPGRIDPALDPLPPEELESAQPVVGPLRDFLQASIELLPDDEIEKYFMRRRRPRRAGKTLEFKK